VAILHLREQQRAAIGQRLQIQSQPLARDPLGLERLIPRFVEPAQTAQRVGVPVGGRDGWARAAGDVLRGHALRVAPRAVERRAVAHRLEDLDADLSVQRQVLSTRLGRRELGLDRTGVERQRFAIALLPVEDLGLLADGRGQEPLGFAAIRERI